MALALIGLGVLALVGWLAQGFFTASEIPLVIRIAVGAIGFGGVILIGVVIKDRLTTKKNDDFKEVEN